MDAKTKAMQEKMGAIQERMDGNTKATQKGWRGR
jgi:hypothetical protein